jgi:hypothetical protein
MCNLNELIREDIIKAIKKYKELDEENKLNPRRKSRDYNLIFEDKKFPPKYIVTIACDIKNHIEPPSYIYQYNFDAPKAQQILKKLGFKIVQKNVDNQEQNEMNSDKINIAIKNFLDDLKITSIQLETPKGRNFFDINTNNKKHIIVKPLGGSNPFPISREAVKKYILTGSPTHPVYIVSIGNYIRDNYMDETVIVLNKDNQSLFTIKNIILYGIAGVGKTHNTNKLITLIESGWSDSDIFKIIKINEHSDSIDISDIKERVKFITFHQSFGYEDFIEGFRPNKEGNIVLIDGIFKEICKEATEDKEKNYYLVIDEINRGNISKIFGELITLIEENKRDKLEITLPYSKELFKIPSNLYIIGTMNSTDKSIALIDIALRRRFTFLKMKPNASLINYSKAKKIFENLNQYILNTLGEDYQIGHSYFMDIGDEDDLEFVLEYKIKPLLEEYFYGDIEGFKKAIDVINGDN